MTLTQLFYDLLVATGILLAGLGLGSLALRPLRLGEPGLLGLWLGAAAGLGLLSFGTLLLGFAGLFFAAVLAPLVIALAMVGLWALVAGLRAHLAAGGPWARGVSGVTNTPLALGYVLLLLLAGGSLIWVLLTHTLLPPHDWDVLSYHLALPKLYLEAQRPIYVPYMLHANWPMNFEMLYVLALALGSDLAVHLVTFGFLLLIVVGLLLLSRRLLDDRVGAIAAALFLVVPLVKRVGANGLIDVGMGLYVLGAALSFERWQRARRNEWLLLCGAFCGMAAGSKLMGGGFALLYGLLLLWTETRRWLGARPRRAAQLATALLRHGLIFGLAGLALVSPWYLRSYLNTGNPVWPFGYHLFGGRDWDELGNEYNMHLMYDVWATGVPRTPIGAAQLFGQMLSVPEELGGYRGGIGAILPIGALLALALALWAPRFIRHTLWIGLGFYLLWFAIVSHQLRFLLPATPLLALATAWACGRLLDWLRRPALQAAALIALIALIMPEWPWTYAGERNLFASRLPYLSGAESRAAFVSAHVDIMPLFRRANAELPATARVLLLPYETRGYYLERAYIWGHPASQRIIRFEQHASAEELLGTLRGLGVTHVIENSAWIYEGLRYWPGDRALMLDLEARCGQLLLREGEAALYGLRESCMLAATAR